MGRAGARRDHLIEYLHAIQDRFGQLATPHLAALARCTRLPQAEVFEVASFHHHFDGVREDAQGGVPAPAALTVRVCDGLSCELAGASDLLQRLPALLGTAVRVIPAPCIGRCEQAPAVAVHQHALARADAEAVFAAVRAGRREADIAGAQRPDAYPVALKHSQDLAAPGVSAGAAVTLTTRRGHIALWARADEGTPPGAVFVAFCWAEVAVNRLTQPTLDPVAKIPEFKHCALRLGPGGVPPAAPGYGGQVHPATESA